ncbi:MAG TPA: hypothetical protein PKE21_03740 [Flavobacteriales bacterium]|nr:hypothetical protein [Flavobacteriales bacterium]HMR26568.1 hypothetical protein [Flavobacteriales bacterium]
MRTGPEGTSRKVVKGGRLTGALAFVIVLLFMPIGHALMVLNEAVLGASKLVGAGSLGTLGALLLLLGVRLNRNALSATLLGLVAGILVWTGWVEFSFVWIAEKHGVAPLMDGDEVATRPEYLVMVSSLGLLGCMLLFFLFTSTRCTLFLWFQRQLRVNRQAGARSGPGPGRPVALVTFIETVMIIWTFYLLLLLAYDPDLAGDRHPLTWLVAFGSLAWSAWLIARLLRIHAFDHAVRYAVPTVVIFWNFVEVAGRWGLFKEIWVHPLEHWVENSLIALALLLFMGRYVLDHARGRRLRPTGPAGPA